MSETASIDSAPNPPADQAAPKKGRAKAILLAIAAIALIGLAIFGFRYFTYGKYIMSTDDAYIQSDSITIAPKISGYVDQLAVTDNQFVKQGDLLLIIDPRDYQAESQQASAQIAVAEASANGAAAQVEEQIAAIARAEADVSAAKADSDFAAQEVRRYRPLAASGAEAGEKLAQLETQAAQSRARLQAAEAALNSARKRVTTLKSQEEQARAQSQAARAKLAAVQTNVEATQLRAPANGRIGNKSVRQGQFVQASTPLMTLVPNDSLYVTANFKETQVGLMRIGQPVRLEVDALPDLEIHGRIESISPATGAEFSILPPQNATGNFTKIVQRIPVRIAIEASPSTRKLLIAGMSVGVSVDTRTAKDQADRLRNEQEQHNARTKK